MGNKYECDKCHKTAWLERKSRCRYGCGGEMAMLSKSLKRTEVACVVCGTMFSPRTDRIRCCGDVCSLEHSRRRERERQRNREDGRTRTDRPQARPWQWLEFNAENDKRTPVKLICRTVEVEYPWVDVLSGNAPAWSAA